jgi:hypothetical protein
MFRPLAVAASILCFGCKSAPTTVNTASVPAASAPAPQPMGSKPTPKTAGKPHPVDALFHSYREKLPAPATLSEGNGASLKCPHHGYVTYTLLDATAKKLPITSEDDVPALIPWLRDPDACLRQIALEALFPKIGFDSNRLSLPNMHDPEHVQYHDIFVALKSFLDAKRVAYDGHAFDGLMLAITKEEFPRTMQGAWKEAVGPSHNFQYLVDIDAQTISVTHKLRREDPKWPVRTLAAKIKEVRVNARLQWQVSVETPEAETYLFWPSSKDVVWFDNGTPGDWMKLTR